MNPIITVPAQIENVQELVEKYLAFERTTLAEIDAIVNQLMDF